MTLDEIKEKYKDVADLFVWDGRTSVEVSRIVVNPNVRNQGIGTKIMNEIIAYADSVHKPVSLSPSKDFGGKIGKLKKFYGGLGFKPNKGRNKDFRISNSMIRPTKEPMMETAYSMLYKFLESFNDNELHPILMEGLDAVTADEPFDVKTFKRLPSFAARVKYAKSKLPQLGTGSSRTAFDLGGDKVLKLAKNAKGIAQNGVESDGYVQSSGVVAKVYDSDPEDLWVICDKVDKVTPKEFGSLLGIPFDFYCKAIMTYDTEAHGGRGPKYLTHEQMQPLWDNEFVCGIFDLMGSMELLGGDLSRIGSYGKCRGDLLLRDAGYTKTVHNEHYNKKSRFESVKSDEADEYIIGGRADGMTPEDIARKHGLPVEDIEEQLDMGEKVEMEHTNDPKMAREIAMDHEEEIPDYYDRLKKIEEDAGIMEGQGFYPEHKYPAPDSTRDRLILAIISMYKAMSDKNKKVFLTQNRLDGVAKYDFDRYSNDDVLRIKMNADDIRDQEKDMKRFTPEAQAKEARRKERETKMMSKADDYLKAESARYDAEYEEYLKESDPEAYKEHMHWKDIKNL